jgi:hypothetical protein
LVEVQNTRLFELIDGLMEMDRCLALMEFNDCFSFFSGGLEAFFYQTAKPHHKKVKAEIEHQVNH